MNAEKFIYDRIGIRKEYPKTNLLVLVSIVIASDIYCRMTDTIIKGQIPSEGPGIIIANHTGTGDILRMGQAGRITAGRIIRGVARHTLLDPNAQESATVQERIGQKNDILNSNNLLVKLFIRYPLAFALNGYGAIPIKRGMPDIAGLRAINQALHDEYLVGIFLQEERIKEGILRNLMLGPAFLATHNPDVPIIPVGISGSPDGPPKINIGKAFTYAENFPRSKKRIDQLEATIYFADKVSELLPKRPKDDWKERKKEESDRLAANIKTS